MAGRKGYKGGRGGGKGGAGVKTCNKCHKVGHFAADCRSGGKVTVTCNRCKKVGHLAADCRSGGKYSTGGKTFKCTNCNMNNHTTADCSKGSPGKNSKVLRPCRFCGEMHMDKDCPTKGGSSISTSHHDDTSMIDVFGKPTFDPPCAHCSGQHFTHQCPTVNHPPASQFQYQRFTLPGVPQTSVFDSIYNVQEEFVTGDPWQNQMRHGYVDIHHHPTFYTAPVTIAFQLQQQWRIDMDGDVIMMTDW